MGVPPPPPFGGFAVDQNTLPATPVLLPPHLQHRFRSQGVVCFGVATCQRLGHDGGLRDSFVAITQRYLWVMRDRDQGAADVTHAIALQDIHEIVGFGEACSVVMIVPTPARAGDIPSVVLRYVNDPMNSPNTPHGFVAALMRTAHTQAGVAVRMRVRPPADSRTLEGLAEQQREAAARSGGARTWFRGGGAEGTSSRSKVRCGKPSTFAAYAYGAAGDAGHPRHQDAQGSLRPPPRALRKW